MYATAKTIEIQDDNKFKSPPKSPKYVPRRSIRSRSPVSPKNVQTKPIRRRLRLKT